MFTALLLIILTIASRLIPHFPNFSPLVAVALFSGVYLKGRYAFLIPLSIYVVSDLIIGLHDVVIFTWSSILIIYFLGTILKRKLSFINTVSFTFFSSFLFFVITNFGVWLVGWYPHTLEGLIRCYTLALPFFRTSLFANFIYVGILFGSYELIKNILEHRKKTKFPLPSS